ncbi:MAG: thiamine phosphate synthase, partial [Candidatus Accumulibacter sp.]|nr:thiamine phosphate synthase [Accumulibacter sp.]
MTPEWPDTDADDSLARVQAALRGGARILQYRDKSGDAARQYPMARALRALTR